MCNYLFLSLYRYSPKKGTTDKRGRVTKDCDVDGIEGVGGFINVYILYYTYENMNINRTTVINLWKDI